jgi:hypothetical protein
MPAPLHELGHVVAQVLGVKYPFKGVALNATQG